MDGNVGIGNTTPANRLSVDGIIESTSGGIKYPDGTVQTTAATGGNSNVTIYSYGLVIIDVDGGGACSVYDPASSLIFADGGTSVDRFGISDVTLNAGTSTTVYGAEDNTIDGGDS